LKTRHINALSTKFYLRWNIV